MGKLLGRRALITGAASGIGLEITRTFAREGADIAINDVRREGVEAVATEVEAMHRRALRLPFDVSDSVEVRAAFEEIQEQWGSLDILVNNAGMVLVSEKVKESFEVVVGELMSGSPVRSAIGATSSMADSQWRRTLSVHLDGTFYCMREALSLMEPQGAGVIVNMASIAGLAGLPVSPDYSAAKAGIIGLTKAAARDVAGRGIRINAIAPGFIDTPLIGALSEPMRRLIHLQTPLGRLGTAAEVAAAALFLASDDSSFTTGQVLSPNGGYVI